MPVRKSDAKELIGVVHLKPLPGAPRFGGSLAAIIKSAVKDAIAYEAGGADAVFIENFGDVPFTKGAVAPATVAAMAVCGRAVGDVVGIPIGFNVLRNDPQSALGLCVACAGGFIRVNVHSGAMLTDQGMIEGDAFSTLRTRAALGSKVGIYADVHVKHATIIGDQLIEDAAKDTLDRGLADALIVSGSGTGSAAAVSDVQRVRQVCPVARILLGSGVNEKNVAQFSEFADGFIVGSSLKRGGRLDAPVDPRRVERLIKALG
jgi:uncharacterized protein